MALFSHLVVLKIIERSFSSNKSWSGGQKYPTGDSAEIFSEKTYQNAVGQRLHPYHDIWSTQQPSSELLRIGSSQVNAKSSYSNAEEILVTLYV